MGLKPWLLSDPQIVTVANDLRSRGLSKTDQQRLHRGYYEELGDVARFDNELWRMYGQAPPDWGREMATMEKRADAIGYSDLPGVSARFKGATFSTNADGLRDRAYPREKPPGSCRAALLGASHDAGEGVPDGATYESVAESILAARMRFEFLNFAASGYAPVQTLGGELLGDMTLSNRDIYLVKNLNFFQEYDFGNSGAAKTVSWTPAPNAKITLNADTTLYIKSPPGVGHYQLRMIQDATGGRAVTVTNVGSSKWLNSAAQPSFNTAASGETILTFSWTGSAWIAGMQKVGTT